MFISSREPSSLPKHISSTNPRESRSATEPKAKFGALAQAKTEGISNTKSAPHFLLPFGHGDIYPPMPCHRAARNCHS